MKKIFENFKKMPLFSKIAAIAFLASLIVLLFSTLCGYIGDVFFFGLFKALLENVYGFFSVILYFISGILQIVFVAALIAAMFTGDKGKVAFVLLCKAILIAVNMFFVTPFMRFTLVISYGFRASIIPGGVIFRGFISILVMFGLMALSVLLLNGFGKFTKLAGIITAAVFSVVFIIDIVYYITCVVDSIKYFIEGKIVNGVFGLLTDSTGDCASIILAAGYIALCLMTVFAAKGAIIPKKTRQQAE